MKIPSKNADLRRYVLREDGFRLLGFAAWIAFWTFGVILFNRNRENLPESARLVGWKMILFLVLLYLVGGLVCKIWRLFSRPTLRGKVLSSSLTHSYSSSGDPGLLRDADYEFRTNAKLILVTGKGKRRSVVFEQKPGSYVYYSEGREILRFHGLTYPLALEQKPGEPYLCVACGNFTPDADAPCPICRHSIINPAEIK